MIIIDGDTYDADMFLMPEFEENFEILSGSNSGRLQDGSMYIEPIGTFYNCEFRFVRRAGCLAADWDKFYNVISAPDNRHMITVPHNQGIITYAAYVSSGKRALVKRESGVNHWGDITCSFVAMEPYRRA